MSDDTILIEKRFQLMLSMQEKRWEQKFGALQAKIVALENRPQPAQVQRPEPMQTPEVKQQTFRSVEQKAEQHPRQFENPDEISIEKFFYCGKS